MGETESIIGRKGESVRVACLIYRFGRERERERERQRDSARARNKDVMGSLISIIFTTGLRPNLKAVLFSK